MEAVAQCNMCTVKQGSFLLQEAENYVMEKKCWEGEGGKGRNHKTCYEIQQDICLQ